MVAGLAELLSTPAWDSATFPSTEGQHERVLARNGSDTVTIATRGLLRDDPSAHAEFLHLAQAPRRGAA